jgi:aminopeptidase N
MKLPYIAFVFILSSCNKEFPLPTPGVSVELNEHRKKIISDVSYVLSLDIPESKSDPIEGSISIDFVLSDASQPLVIDFNVKDGNVKSVFKKMTDSLDFIFANEHIIIQPEDLVTGRQAFTIHFTAGDQSLNRNDEYLYTLFVPDRASTCFPLFDQPNLKAKYTLFLKVPYEWKVVSNGELKSSAIVDGRGHYVFGETKPISSYLFAFGAGKFRTATEQVDGREMTMYYRETDSVKVNKNKEEIFSLHGKSLKWLEDYTAIPYPFGKFDFVLIPSFQYGGMEHPGSIFYNESALFLDDNASVNRKMGRASLIAHETAHMWFGDLVTMDWFNDVWMKEVFANFMAAKIVQPSFPEIDHDLRFLLAHYPGAYSVDRTKGANPIIQPLDNLKNAGTMYGSIIYQKAPIVMRHLERMTGEDKMRESLQEYLQKFQFGNAVWDDLVKIIDERTPQDIASWSNVWVKTPGMPEYQWRSIGDTTLAVLEQMPDSLGRTWIQPIMLNPCGLKDGGDIVVDSLEDARSHAQEYCAIFTNIDGFSYGFFHLRKPELDYFVNHYKSDRKPAFRATMIMNFWESMLHDEAPQPTKMLSHLSDFLKQEDNPLIIDYILSQLETLWWTFLPDEVRSASQQETEQLLWTLLQKTNDKGIKTSYFRTYRSITSTGEGLSNLENIWNGSLVVPGLTLSEDDRITLAYELALKLPGKQTEILSKQLELTQNPDRKERLKFVTPALSSDEKIRDAFFESLKLEVNREHEPWVLEALSYLHHPLRAKSSEKHLLSSLELLQEIQLTGDIFFPQRWLNTTFEGHASQEAVETVDKFLGSRSDYPEYLKNKILQAVDGSERAVNVRVEK